MAASLINNYSSAKVQAALTKTYRVEVVPFPNTNGDNRGNKKKSTEARPNKAFKMVLWTTFNDFFFHHATHLNIHNVRIFKSLRFLIQFFWRVASLPKSGHLPAFLLQ